MTPRILFAHKALFYTILLILFSACFKEVDSTAHSERQTIPGDKKIPITENWEICGDLAISAACAEGWIPGLLKIVNSAYPSDDMANLDSASAIRRLPVLFFITTFCDNDISSYYYIPTASTIHHLSGVNPYLNDVCIANIDSCYHYIDDNILAELKSRFFNGVKLITPEYINQKIYPDSLSLSIYKQPITDMDIVRVEALCGDENATKKLEKYYRSKDAIGEMAFYYYFQALTENDPDKLFIAARMMYEASKRRPYALAGMINMLKAGKRMGSEQCSNALQEIYRTVEDLK